MPLCDIKGNVDDAPAGKGENQALGLHPSTGDSQV